MSHETPTNEIPEKPAYILTAEKISQEAHTFDELMHGIRKSLHKHFQEQPTVTQTRSLLDSRLTPTKEQYEMNMATCGAQVNIETDMLRSLGYEVKKVHGKIEGHPSVHAWIKVWSDQEQEWIPWDLTQSDMKPSEKHHEIAECNEWEEIAEVLKQSSAETTKTSH